MCVSISALNAAGQDNVKPKAKIFTDSRDKKVYKIAGFGTQIWMTENLKFRPVDLQKSWCYGDDEKNCEKYGALYNWESAVESCPNGWRMPTAEDWKTLESFLETSGKTKEIGKMILDADGFNAMLAGFRLDNGRFVLLESHALFWSSEVDTEFSEQAVKFGRYFGRHLYKTDQSTVKFEPSRGKPNTARSLRCVQK